jgi:hypothetical protein
MNYLSYTKSRYLTNTPTRFGLCWCHLQGLPSQPLNFSTHQMVSNNHPTTLVKQRDLVYVWKIVSLLLFKWRPNTHEYNALYVQQQESQTASTISSSVYHKEMQRIQYSLEQWVVKRMDERSSTPGRSRYTEWPQKHSLISSSYKIKT